MRARFLRWIRTPESLVALFFLVGLAIRFYRLDGRSLWLDEAVTATSVHLGSFSEVMRYVHFWYDNMPLIFIITWLTEHIVQEAQFHIFAGEIGDRGNFVE